MVRIHAVVVVVLLQVYIREIILLDDQHFTSGATKLLLPEMKTNNGHTSILLSIIRLNCTIS